MIRDNFPKRAIPDAKFPSIPPRQTVATIVSFLERWLPNFRNNYIRKNPETLKIWEDDISKDLNFFLQAQAKSSPFLFHMDARKGVDFLIMVQPYEISASPIYAIEAKRLRTKTRDYVEGGTGGIERFKREQEGFDYGFNECAMVAYVQEKSFSYWFQKINEWVNQLIQRNHEIDEIDWDEYDKLVEVHSNTDAMSLYCSKHARKTKTELTIRHFWLNMQ